MSIIVGEIIGYRCWTVKDNWLASFNGYVWTIGANKIERDYLLDDEETSRPRIIPSVSIRSSG